MLQAIGRAMFLAVALAAGAPGHAAVVNVDTTVDDASLAQCDDARPNDCSLRGAIVKANRLSEPLTINVPAGTYVLSQASPCAFRGESIGALFNTPGLCATGTMTLKGAGADRTIIDGNQPPGQNFTLATLFFVATTGDVTMQGFTLRRGNFSIGFLEGAGGGINNAGRMALLDSVVSDNWSSSTGGGIYNQGRMTLLRSVVTRNFAAGGGAGIWNTNTFGTCPTSPCHDGEGVLSIADSTISDNGTSMSVEGGGPGGGITNFVGMIDMVDSTVSGNQANGAGGGIYNAAWNVNLTNVTVSGNRANSGGGIVNQGPTYSTMHLDNVTITNNVAQWFTDPTRGIGGGLTNGDLGTVTLANTIIAGNRATETSGGLPWGADCFAFGGRNAALTSQGRNLIEDPHFCDTVGDTASNITGQDARLGVLADNGGYTRTHAPAPGSPAIDAGSSAAPGSGGASCALRDQRGFPRPLGARCDIGALERSGAFAITRVRPALGGSSGTVTALVSGNGFVEGSVVKLTRAGATSVVGAPTRLDEGGSALYTTFDLRGKPAGAWNVVVVRPDATSVTLANGFTVQPNGSPDLWVDVAPFALPRFGGVARITIVYGNRGSVDALAVPLQISASRRYGFTTVFDIAPPPAQPDQRLVSYDQVPFVLEPSTGGYTTVPLLLPIVPAGFTGMLQVLLEVPVPSPTAPSTLFVNLDTPYVVATPTDVAVNGLVAGATAYAPRGFHITIPATLAPALRQYVRNQLQLLVEQGRSAFLTSLGTAPQIYSATQLLVDTAVVGAYLATHP